MPDGVKYYKKGNVMKTLNDAVVERLNKYMGERNLTQYKLAQLSGVPFPTVKSIIQRRTKGIGLKTIIMLADGLGISPSEFIDVKGLMGDSSDNIPGLPGVIKNLSVFELLAITLASADSLPPLPKRSIFIMFIVLLSFYYF